MKKQYDFFTFLDHFADAAIIINDRQELCCANDTFEKLTGYKSSVLFGQPLFESFQSDFKLDIGVCSLRTSSGLNLTLEASSSKVTIEGGCFTLVLLTPSVQPALSKFTSQLALQETAIKAWKIGTFAHDQQSGEFYTSALLSKLYGVPDDQLLTADILVDAVLGIDKEAVIDAITHAHDPAGDGVFNILHRVLLEGETRWLHTRSHTRFEEIEGKRVAVETIGSVMDVTEQKALELKIMNNEDRLTQAIELSQVGIFEHDHIRFPSGDLLYWSPMFREILGIDKDVPFGLDWYLAGIHSEDIDMFGSALRLSHDPDSDGEFKLEYRWAHPDGKLRWLSTRGKTYFANIDGELKPVRSVGAVIDITERKAIEEDQQRRTAILEATPDFVSITDTEGNLVYLNQAGRELLGFSSDEDVSEKHMSLAHTEASLKVLENEGLQALFNTGMWIAESEFVSYEGRVVPMSQVLLVHRNNKGKLDYISTIARDLSKEKNLEEQFQQAQKMEAIGRLAGGIAHDFNNMLSVIMGFTALAVDKIGLDHEANEELDEVLRAADRAAALTGQLLSFSRKQIFRLQVIDINQLLLDMEPMLKRLVNESIQLSIEPSPFEARIKVDPNQMEQVFLNLVVNASDAMPQGGSLRITLRQVRFDKGLMNKHLNLPRGDYIEIIFSDTGEGMNSSTCEKVFEPFFTTKGAGQGTGLGLATVFGIVSQSDGGILLDSEVGKGTVFTLYFPSSDEELSFEGELVLAPSTQSHVGEVVLVVEDEEQLRAMAVTCLESAGYTVLSAADPQLALEVAGGYQGKIDLLLTDVVMPKMTGKQLADHLLLVRPETTVLYMSGYTEDSIVDHGVLNDDVHFIPKPITPRSLLAKVEQVLEQSNISE